MIRARVAERSYVIPARVRRRRAFFKDLLGVCLANFGPLRRQEQNREFSGDRCPFWLPGAFRCIVSAQDLSLLVHTFSRVYFSHADIGLMV